MTNQIADIRGLAELFQESTRRRLLSSIRTVVKKHTMGMSHVHSTWERLRFSVCYPSIDRAMLAWLKPLRAKIDNNLLSILFVSTLVQILKAFKRWLYTQFEISYPQLAVVVHTHNLV